MLISSILTIAQYIKKEVCRLAIRKSVNLLQIN